MHSVKLLKGAATPTESAEAYYQKSGIKLKWNYNVKVVARCVMLLTKNA